jgi:membrane protein implicated in regulation of membrane protease activity
MAMVTQLFGLHWGWMALGVALAIAEIVAPGYFLIWLAAAALLTGLVAATVPVGLVARRWVQRHPVQSADPMLNDRGGQIVGQSVVVTHVIEGGSGRVRHGDTEWLARGPDAQPGTRMRVTGADGTALLVEHLH